MNDGNIEVDFGDKGQINGFDAWRLSDFVEKNKIETTLTDRKKIEAAIKEVESAREIIFSGHIMYYLKNDI